MFDRKGHIYFSIGERGQAPHAQELNRPNGKVHRINEDGTIPKDNPFVGKPPALASIYTYGNRNPQGLTIQPSTGVIWEVEHGPRGGDELNVIRPGRNYGWPVITYGMNYNGTPWTDITAKEGMEQPITYWTPSLAVSSVAFYAGDKFPQWKGNILLASLAFQELRRLELTGEKVTHQEVLFKDVGRLRDMIVGPDGYVYIAFNQPDRIARLVPGSRAAARRTESQLTARATPPTSNAQRPAAWALGVAAGVSSAGARCPARAELRVEVRERLLEHRAMARIAGGLQRGDGAGPGQAQAFPLLRPRLLGLAHRRSLTRGALARGGVLLLLDRLALPAARHACSIGARGAQAASPNRSS